jgi:peptidoglycan/xylan/chitin deacetylase (PgdA/CDA1 family)
MHPAVPSLQPSRATRRIGLIAILACLLAGCTSLRPVEPTPSPTSSAFPTPIPSLTPIPSVTPVPSPTPIRTPPALPDPYQTTRLNPIDQPVGYIEDSCQYLQMKWDPDNAAPGTIVVPIMFHGIPGIETNDPNEITQLQFEKLIADLKEQGFEAITISQLADFLETNAKIPPRSFVMILDDRRPGTAFATFLPMLEANNWRMSLAWPIGYGDDTTDKKPATYVDSDPLAGTYLNLWAQIEHYYQSGRFEVESHGYYHNIPMSNDSTDDYLRQELEQSMAELEAHFGRRPVAIIWPGGGFAKRPVEFARAAGYRVGFTINPRGPLMFNWIPQAQASDPMRPVYLPEGPAGDPLLTLPRYWPSQVSGELDNIRLMSKEAAAHAEANRATELEYYDILCAPEYGPLSAQ